tara:strand:- start:60 stop:1361 length:1302 start_codon:yes stop_codon:yes gene_type:complete
MAETAALLADEVFPDVPLRQWVISFPFPLRYLFAAHPQAMGKVLGIVYRAISTHLIHKSELSLKEGATGAVTLIQRFGSALNLNIHFHILFLDGVYVHRDNRPPRFQRVKAPDKGELEELVQLISQRVGRCLERQGLLEQNTESAWLDLDPAEDTDAMPQILGSSISYRIAVGPQQGRKAFMIRTIRPLDRPDPGLERVARANGFSLHAGISCEGIQKDKRERLCRYISRPAVAVPRLSLSSTGKVVYTLKTPYRDGTTQVAFDRGGHPSVDFVARLAALVPKPRVNLTRYHGVLAPNHRWRGLVTPARRGKGIKSISNAEVRTPAERHAAMTWAQRLKRVFSIDIEVCGRCGGSVRVIASIEGQDVIDRILTHLRQKEQETPTRPLLVPPTRAPPGTLPLFAGKRFQHNSTTPARKPVNTAWHELSRAPVQE